MQFQGENCTLTFSLHFASGQILLSGSIWQGRPASEPSAYRSDPLRFSLHLTESELNRIQQWLTSESKEPFNMPDPIRQMRRMDVIDDDSVYIELDYHRPVPPWWEWAVSNPLKIRLRIRPSEFAYLTKSLRRDHWMTNLNW